MGKAYFCELQKRTMPVAAPPTHLKKTERNARLAKLAEQARVSRAEAVKAKKADWLKRGESSFKAHTDFVKSEHDKSTAAAQNGELYVPASPKVFLVIRIKGINKVDPKSKLILRLLRLRQINNATFLKGNKATMNMLQRVQPYVAYGFPNRKTIEMLVYKRGYGKVKEQRVRLSNNFVVEDNLSKFNCVCVEDIVNEILTCGPNFKQVNNFLWPFKLNSAKGGFARKSKSYLNAGVFGNRENYINPFVRKM